MAIPLLLAALATPEIVESVLGLSMLYGVTKVQSDEEGEVLEGMLNTAQDYLNMNTLAYNVYHAVDNAGDMIAQTFDSLDSSNVENVEKSMLQTSEKVIKKHIDATKEVHSAMPEIAEGYISSAVAPLDSKVNLVHTKDNLLDILKANASLSAEKTNASLIIQDKSIEQQQGANAIATTLTSAVDALSQVTADGHAKQNAQLHLQTIALSNIAISLANVVENMRLGVIETANVGVATHEVAQTNMRTEDEQIVKTLERTKLEYETSTQSISDLDGESVVSATPLEIDSIHKATQSRLATDTNNFELDDSDFDIFPLDINISEILTPTLPSERYANYYKSSGGA